MCCGNKGTAEVNILWIGSPVGAQIQDVAGVALPALAAGEFYEVTVTTTVDAESGTVTNTATVTLPPGVDDPSPENHVASAVTPVDPVDPDAPMPDPDDPALPSTGSDPGRLLLLAGLLLALGGLFAGGAVLRRHRS